MGCVVRETTPPVVSCAPPTEQSLAQAFAQFCAVGAQSRPWYEADNIELWRTYVEAGASPDHDTFVTIIARAASRAGVEDCPRLRFGRGEGRIAKRAIAESIGRNIRGLNACYRQRLEARPRLFGHVELTFLIRPDGRVASSWLTESQLGDAQVETCITHWVRTLRFEGATGDSNGLFVIHVPFILANGRVE
jgi:hypothetical protein